MLDRVSEVEFLAGSSSGGGAGRVDDRWGGARPQRHASRPAFAPRPTEVRAKDVRALDPRPVRRDAFAGFWRTRTPGSMVTEGGCGASRSAAVYSGCSASHS